MPQKTIAIYFSDPEPTGYPFDKKEYLEIYQEIIRDIESHGINVVMVRGDSYRGQGRFTHGWRFENDQIVKVPEEIIANLIFNRDDKNTIPKIYDCPMINHPDFDALCLDKIKTAKMFPEFSPKTAAIHSFEEYKKIIGQWSLQPTDRVALKQNFETEGRGVYILPVSETMERLYSDWSNILLQEFIDCSIGIAGLTKEKHDLRITVVNSEIINSYIRIPKAGSYLANVAQGGKGSSVDLAQVPPIVLGMVKDIDQKIAHFRPTLYAADFMNSPTGFKLIELNSRPAVQHPSWSKTYKKFNNAVVHMLVEAVR